MSAGTAGSAASAGVHNAPATTHPAIISNLSLCIRFIFKDAPTASL